jgi:hypothetical protein
MAHATYATRAIRAPIAGASAKLFTSPNRAVQAQIAAKLEYRLGPTNKPFEAQLQITAIAEDSGRVA